MMPADPAKLIGRYRTPRFKYGAVVTDAVRGDVVIVGLSDARIPWPIGKPRQGHGRSLVVFGALERAIRTESNLAVCHWWGVCPWMVSKWRRLLDVGPVNPGSSKLRRERLLPRVQEMIACIDHTDPVRNAKIGDALRGKPRPKHVRDALLRASRNQVFTDARRKALSERNRAMGIVPPKAVDLWTPAEDRLIRRLPTAEAAKRTGRTMAAVRGRRYRLNRMARRA